MSPRFLHVPDDAKELSDDRADFSRADYVAAFSLVCARDEAERWTDELLQPDTDNPGGYATHLSDDVLDLLSLASEDCARRVQAILRLSDEDAEARRARVRRRLARRQATKE